MTYPKKIKPKAANDNRHDQFSWEFLHRYLDRWLVRYNISPKQWPYNRSIHYMYELKNRPWLHLDICTDAVVDWLFDEAKALGIQTSFGRSI